MLRPGGRLVVADMLPHDRDEYRQTMGHVWLGFSERQVAKYFAGAGFEGVYVRTLAPHQGSKGPALFVASGRSAGAADVTPAAGTPVLTAAGVRSP